jgi:hypothetical protein
MLFMVNEAALDQVFLRDIRVSPVNQRHSIAPYLLIYHRSTTWAVALTKKHFIITRGFVSRPADDRARSEGSIS